MQSRSCKAKGRRAANEVKEMIHGCFPGLGDNDVIRTSSGCTGEDIVLSPKAREVLPISIEVKNVEALNIWKALKQCEDNARDCTTPALFFRRNKTIMYAAVPADYLLVQYATIELLRKAIERLEKDLHAKSP